MTKLSAFKALLAMFVALSSIHANAVRVYIHVQGDSNSQGMLPGAQSQFSMDVGAGRNAAKPWPMILEQRLLEADVDAIVINHSETGRRLVGRTALDCERNGVGQKDGRVALQQIITTMMNQAGEQSRNVALLINLGTNDLQVSDLTLEKLQERMIKHVAAILTNPSLQYNLLNRIGADERAAVTQFMTRLNQLTNRDIENEGNDEALFALLVDNRNIIVRLFNLIEWRIVIVPPVIVVGHPFGAFPSAALSQLWPTIIDTVVRFFGNPNLITVPNAQAFAGPRHEEFGGRAHLDEPGHLDFGNQMAAFLLTHDRFQDTFVRRPGDYQVTEHYRNGRELELKRALVDAIRDANIEKVRQICVEAHRQRFDILNFTILDQIPEALMGGVYTDEYPLDYARSLRRDEIAAYLVQQGARNDPHRQMRLPARTLTPPQPPTTGFSVGSVLWAAFGL